MSIRYLIILIFVLLLGGAVWAYQSNQTVRRIISNQPNPSPSLAIIPAASDNITVNSPQAGSTVGSPFIVSGQARVFENMVSIRLRELNGDTLVQTTAYANAPDVGQFGPFEEILEFSPPQTEELVLEVYQASPRDGGEIDRVAIPLVYGQSEQQLVRVFFGNSQQDDEGCNVFSTSRVIPPTDAVGQAALNQLLNGPTESEKARGFITSIPEGTRLQRLTINGGIARADFNENLQQGVGGSCRVLAIRSQITETLTQFPTVNEVIISINGRTEDILQP